MAAPELGEEFERLVERMVMSIQDDILYSLRDGAISSDLLFRRVRDMRQGHLTHAYFDNALLKLTAEGRVKGLIMNNEPDGCPEMDSPDDKVPPQMTSFDIRHIALAEAIQAVGPRSIMTDRDHREAILETARAFENYMMGVVPDPKRSRQSSGGQISLPAKTISPRDQEQLDEAASAAAARAKALGIHPARKFDYVDTRETAEPMTGPGPLGPLHDLAGEGKSNDGGEWD